MLGLAVQYNSGLLKGIFFFFYLTTTVSYVAKACGQVQNGNVWGVVI